MSRNPFAFEEDNLADYYHLKTLDPKTSWENDSNAFFPLDKFQSENSEESYAILNELLQQEHEFNSRKKSNVETADLPDPLGSKESLSKLLDRRGIPQRERYKYYTNSKKFNSKLYLKNVHPDDDFQHLSESLDYLDRSLQAQSEELKQLVQRNFVKYVRSKNNLDRIYDQFNKLSAGGANELGVDKLGGSVDETIRETTLRLKPLMDANNKLKKYQSTISFVQENKEFFNLPRLLKSYLNKKDYTNLLFEYTRAQRKYKALLSNSGASPILDRIWNEVENTVDTYRKYTWEMLITARADETQEHFLPLISKLLDLKVEDNPIISWINTRLDGFESQLGNLCDQMLSKIVHAQQNILKDGGSGAVDLSFYLSIDTFPDHSESNENAVTAKMVRIKNHGLTDTPIIIEMWLLILKFIASISTQSYRFIEFWEHVEKFLDGTYQTSLINDKRKDNILNANLETRDNYRSFLELEEYQIDEVRKRGELFVKHLSDRLRTFFLASQDSLRDGKEINKDTGSPNDYGFIPPNANGLGCLRYLPRIVEPILKFTTELAQLNITTSTIETLRKLDTAILDRSVSAISSTRLRDISEFHTLEDWTIFRTFGDQNYGVTQFPEIVRSFQKLSIKTIRDMLFSFEKLPILNGIYVVTHPSRQLITGIEVQQIISMEAVLESTLKDAAKDKESPRNPRTILTLTNLQYIREQIFPEILHYFDEWFEWHLSQKNLEIFALLAKMESSIFGNYLSDLKVNLRDVLEDKFHDISWPTYSSHSFRAGDYIIEALMILVTVHSECFRIAPQLISKIIKETQIFISRYLFEAFKPYIGNISSDGLLQVTVDLQFFQRVLGKLLERETEATLVACLQNCFENDVSRMQRCIKETEPIVTSNLNRTNVQFSSFKQ
ncbi:LAFE_0H07316g1_1 [Lachancea fermentati]|uniref:Exocyst complex component SEC5 n=1 Tax=Lachancea fermentati TaxID=4955 RepID=A0A1G4MJV6_LACFM|nr:LAFE_0H07316g1_1 [Lachancea fermentati]